METPTKNEPTILEYIIVYIVLGLIIFGVYKVVLQPRGYTPGKVYKMVVGDKKKKEAMKAPEMKTAAEMKVEEKKSEPEMKAPVMSVTTPVKVMSMGMELSEDDD